MCYKLYSVTPAPKFLDQPLYSLVVRHASNTSAHHKQALQVLVLHLASCTNTANASTPWLYKCMPLKLAHIHPEHSLTVKAWFAYKRPFSYPRYEVMYKCTCLTASEYNINFIYYGILQKLRRWQKTRRKLKLKCSEKNRTISY